ncbi:hypothetical protein NC651_010204 [Populus alba x Populus x berolinensis]|nr:hypothetical protein NC651_010204 [Populus alba x Populus x berolinensis]
MEKSSLKLAFLDVLLTIAACSQLAAARGRIITFRCNKHEDCNTGNRCFSEGRHCCTPKSSSRKLNNEYLLVGDVDVTNKCLKPRMQRLKK